MDFVGQVEKEKALIFQGLSYFTGLSRICNWCVEWNRTITTEKHALHAKFPCKIHFFSQNRVYQSTDVNFSLSHPL